MKNKNKYNQDREYDFLFKMMLIGDVGVGKTSFLKSMIGEYFEQTISNTINYDFRIRNNVIINDKNIKLQIWDPYIEKFRNYRGPYRGQHGIFILYDITDRSSFNNIRNWYGEIERYACQDVIVFLVATKLDIADTTPNEVYVTFEEGKQVADYLNIQFFEISSKNDINIQNCLLAMVKDIYELKFDNPPPTSPPIAIEINKKKDNCIIN